MPSRLGVDGIDALPPEHHTLLLAAHAWAHQPLGRLGNLIDVAVSLRRSDEAEVARLARRWGCARMWRTTRAAVRAVVEGGRGSVAVALWARHLPAIRERTVLEWHVKNLLAPAWGYPRRRAPRSGAGPSAGGPAVARAAGAAQRGRRPLRPQSGDHRGGGMSELRLRETDLHWREIDGEVIALEARGSTYLAANGAGTVLWRALIDGSTRERLADELVRAYGIERAQAVEDADRFVDALIEQGLLD